MSPHERIPRSHRLPTPERAQRLLWGLQCTLILAVIWLALTGLDALPLGALTATIAGAFGAWMVPGLPHRWRPLRLFGFTGYFLRTSIAGGLDVAGRALRPQLTIHPTWLRYRLSLPRGQPRTLMISMLSLLPGTLSAELQDDDILLVHALDGSDAQATRESVTELERKLAWFFSLPEPEGDGR